MSPQTLNKIVKRLLEPGLPTSQRKHWSSTWDTDILNESPRVVQTVDRDLFTQDRGRNHSTIIVMDFASRYQRTTLPR